MSDLPTGMYYICGKYKVMPGDDKEYLAGESRLVLVNNMGTTSTIKVVTADGIINFVISNGEVISDRVVTESSLKLIGYTTEEWVNERIKELDLVQRNEIDTYIQNYISTELEKIIDVKIETAMEHKLNPLNDDDVYDLFDSNDDGILDFLQ